MPTKPKIVTLTNASVDVLNAIRNNASINYRNYVPIATPDADCIRDIGAIIMDYPALQNEFLSALINRIGKVILTSKLYDNPWAMFKKGMLEFGESVEEIFVDIAKPYQYDPAVAENKVFQREIPAVRSAFHVMNYQKYYKATIQQEQLRQAFMSWDGVNELIGKIVDAMYTAAAYDEFLTMKYMLAKQMLMGRIKPHTITYNSAADAKSVITEVKSLSNNLTFLNRDNNPAGVATFTLKDNQYVLVNSNFEATMSVEVLASAFNMDKTEFSGHMVLVDSFGKLDTDRLAELFDGDPNYTGFTSAELAALDAVPLLIVDKDYFMIFDNMMQFTEQYNGEGLYWNYWYHAWKIFSVSPFAQAAVFIPESISVTSVTIAPDSVSLSGTFNGATTFTATVVASTFASKNVEWFILDSDSQRVKSVEMGGVTASISNGGVLNVVQSATADLESLTVVAVSTADSSKSDTATVTFTRT